MNRNAPSPFQMYFIWASLNLFESTFPGVQCFARFKKKKIVFDPTLDISWFQSFTTCCSHFDRKDLFTLIPPPGLHWWALISIATGKTPLRGHNPHFMLSNNSLCRWAKTRWVHSHTHTGEREYAQSIFFTSRNPLRTCLRLPLLGFTVWESLIIVLHQIVITAVKK